MFVANTLLFFTFSKSRTLYSLIVCFLIKDGLNKAGVSLSHAIIARIRACDASHVRRRKTGHVRAVSGATDFRIRDLNTFNGNLIRQNIEFVEMPSQF